ncbi:MAG TPA: tetratricopeptide repeat protein [Patescibacteria group bacterium]
MEKKFQYLVALLIALVLIGLGIAYSKKHKQKTPVNPALSAEQNQQFNDKVSQLMKIVKDPKSTKADVEGAWLGIGIYYESLGQMDKEKEAFLKAAETDPNSYLPWSNLATLYVNTKQYDKAAEAFQKGLSINDTDSQFWLKWISFNRYQLQQGDGTIRRLFNDSYKATNNNDLLLRQGASYLEETGDMPGAIAAWQFILKQNPKDAAIKAKILDLQKKLKPKK